eukprot:7386698-Prymnesium_polylepis.2
MEDGCARTRCSALSCVLRAEALLLFGTVGAAPTSACAVKAPTLIVEAPEELLMALVVDISLQSAP